MKKFLTALVLTLSLAGGAFAGPKRLAKDLGAQLKRTFYSDVKAHPVAWGLNAGLQLGIAFTDTATSCANMGPTVYEVGPAHYLVGRSPNCRKLVTLTASAMAVHLTAENWLANEFKNSCDREAANPDSRWWKTPSHTKSTAGCYWGVPLADTIALGAYEIPVAIGNTVIKNP